MAEETGFVIAFYLVLIALPFMFPLLSWALGRWYQGTLMAALIEDEKRHGGMLQNPNQTTTAPITTSMGASSSTLLHVSICVGPPIGQMFFMWVKGLVGGRLESYDAVLDYGRREVLLRLKKQADSLSCTTIQNIRIETSVINFAKNGGESKTSSVEFLAFATGLRF